MSNDLVLIENQLKPLAPHFQQVLGPLMPADRLIRTVVVSVERLPALMQCDRQSLFNAAMSAAVLGLEVDGVTGQAYLIPFKNKAQLVIGYKGFNTMAARSGITITGAVVREGDSFDPDYDRGLANHRPKLGDESRRRIVAAWARASANNRPAVLKVLSIDELLAIKAKSPGAKRQDSPWNDPQIGFPAMCEKSVKRRLARDLPLNVMQLAARMDEAVDEQGRPAHILPERGVVIEGEFSPVAPREHNETPTASSLIGQTSSPPTERDETVADTRGAGDPPREARAPAHHTKAAGPADDDAGARERRFTQSEYLTRWNAIIDAATDAAQLHAAWSAPEQKHIRRALVDWREDGGGEALKALTQKVATAIEFMKG